MALYLGRLTVIDSTNIYKLNTSGSASDYFYKAPGPSLSPTAPKFRTGECSRRTFYNVARLQGVQDVGIRARHGYHGEKDGYS